MEMQGVITKFLEIQSGTTANGEWKKQQFVVKTTDQYNNLYCFEVFGADKVDNLTKYQKVGDEVKVQFNVNTNEWQGKYFTSLSAWRIDKVAEAAPIAEQNQILPDDTHPNDENGGLPF